MAQTKDFTVRVSPEMYSRLKEAADKQYTSIAAVVRQILASAMSNG